MINLKVLEMERLSWITLLDSKRNGQFLIKETSECERREKAMWKQRQQLELYGLSQGKQADTGV